MTNHARIPTEELVRSHLEELRNTGGRTPSILALATRIGLSNTTFRRHFPILCEELRSSRQSMTESEDHLDKFSRLRHDNQRLRAANRDLAADLELAITQIQRLTLDNHRLIEQLHTARSVTSLRRR